MSYTATFDVKYSNKISILFNIINIYKKNKNYKYIIYQLVL